MQQGHSERPAGGPFAGLLQNSLAVCPTKSLSDSLGGPNPPDKNWYQESAIPFMTSTVSRVYTVSMYLGRSCPRAPRPPSTTTESRSGLDDWAERRRTNTIVFAWLMRSSMSMLYPDWGTVHARASPKNAKTVSTDTTTNLVGVISHQ